MTRRDGPPTRRPRGRVVLPVERPGTSRRTFLRMAGFGVAAATLASCTRAPVRFAVPRLEGTEGLPPGRAYRIATTCGGCAAACGVLARCVDGRPIKLEGLPGHPVSDGGLCAVGQAQVLSLYDSRRPADPQVAGRTVSWAAADAAVRADLEAAAGSVRLLTGTVHGPSDRAWIAEFCRRFGARHVAYDARSASAIAAAHEATHGLRAVPRFRFDRADVIASFGADFLGAWLSPVEFAAGWRAGRPGAGAEVRSSEHWQIEARTSMTGLRADRRVRLAPWETGDALAELLDALDPGRSPRLAAAAPRPWVAELAAALAAARGRSLVVCDDGDPAVQALVNAVNERLGNYGSTLDLSTPSHAAFGDDAALAALVEEMRSGAVGVLVVAGCNPLFDLPQETDVAGALSRVRTVVVLTPNPDETSAAASVLLPEAHALESWGDAEPRAGVLAVRQPAIGPLRRARTLRECLARWCGDERPDGELVRDHWRREVYPAVGAMEPFDVWYDRVLEAGHVGVPARIRVEAAPFRPAAVVAPTARARPPAGALALVLYPKVGMPDGAHAHNAWLHELPDPVSKCAWDNYACLSPARAEALGVATGDLVRVAADGLAPVELPALVQPGQHDDVVAVALGYGRVGTDRFAGVGPEWLESRATVEAGGTIGRNAAPLGLAAPAGPFRSGRTVRIERTGGQRALACTQDHHSLHVPAHLAPKGGEVRDAVRTIAFADLAADPARAVERHAHDGPGLWPDDHPATGRRWGMAIDLAACNGCSACVVACQAENNVPVVGRDEVRRHREMHWIRIDRYYEGEGDGLSASQQPMTCQQCAHAPCETVCPVLATVHSAEGLNQQVYNRCVGTRYCANNCPYKARRFNWFDYPREDLLQNLALNPGVTVRTRGVMEKCTFCVQRIQEAKDVARTRGVPLADGDVRPACAESCPSRAIAFGDLNDPASEVARLAAEPRAYRVLAELNVRPSISYLADVRRREPGQGGRHGD